MAPTAATNDNAGGIPVRVDTAFFPVRATDCPLRLTCRHQPELEPHVYRGPWWKHKGASTSGHRILCLEIGCRQINVLEADAQLIRWHWLGLCLYDIASDRH